jgi:hypothetical protein
MKTNLFTIALAVATMVPAFAAQTPAKPAAPADTAKPAATTVKKHHKKSVKKNATKPAAGSTSTTAKPAGSSK